MQVEELGAIERTALRFSRERVVPMVGTEGRDGALEGLSELLGEAGRTGLIASPDPESAGFDYGVWGRASIDEGPAASLALLRALARGCAGVAGCVHVLGLGTAEQLGAPHPLPGAAVAIFDTAWRLEWQSLASPPEHAVQCVRQGRTCTLRGSVASVPRVPGCEGVVVFAAAEGGWELVALPWYTPGLVARAVGDTCGLAAIPLVDLRLEDVEVGSESTLGARSPVGFVHRAMIGWSAIAVGNAEGAYDAAALYAAERYQGGRLIEAHEAVRGLLGDSFSRIEAARAHVDAMALQAPGGALALRRAFAAKLRVTHACRTAVSDCLQVLGGYGYMEDYRLEKRLRDAMMLESIGMRPADLRRLCGAPGAEVAA